MSHVSLTCPSLKIAVFFGEFLEARNGWSEHCYLEAFNEQYARMEPRLAAIIYGSSQKDYTMNLNKTPPLAEQQRIVAKVDELMRWCDALEARLTAARTTATHLLDATLHQILAIK